MVKIVNLRVTSFIWKLAFVLCQNGTKVLQKYFTICEKVLSPSALSGCAQQFAFFGVNHPIKGTSFCRAYFLKKVSAFWFKFVPKC